MPVLRIAFAFLLLAAGAMNAHSDDALDLSFGEFFDLPVGPRGLVMTQTLRAADGRRVRISGYVVHEDVTAPRSTLLPQRMLFAAYPVKLAELADGPADDLPPATLFVHGASRQIADAQGRIQLTGRLRLGRMEEYGGRVSWVRLEIDKE
jgi:hypothetical protein